MTVELETIEQIASGYDAIVFDQWGVLHDGTRAYLTSQNTVLKLHQSGQVLAILSNSGKRAEPNADRIAGFGYNLEWFSAVMTSGEALWTDIRTGQLAVQKVFAVEREKGDAALWAVGLELDLTSNLHEADALLLMGVPDGSTIEGLRPIMDQALQQNLTVICSNPDSMSPRAGQVTVLSPGALALYHQSQGGNVVFYGKPYPSVFTPLQARLGAERILMVGDSLDHDIKGGAAVGWDTLFVTGGLHAHDFVTGHRLQTLDRLVTTKDVPAPTYMIGEI